MPFKSKEQERYLQINEPEIYRDWVEKYGHFKGAESEADDPLKYLSITGYYPKVGRSRRYPVYTGDRWNPIYYGEVSMTGDARGKWNFYWSDGDYGIEGYVRKNKSYYTLSPLYINGHFMANEGPTFQSRTQWDCVLEAIKYAYDFQPRVEDQKKKWWQFWKAESFGADEIVHCSFCSEIIGTEQEVYDEETVEWYNANGETVCPPCYKEWMKEWERDTDMHYTPFYAESFEDFKRIIFGAESSVYYEVLVDETGNGLEEAEIVATYPTFEEAKNASQKLHSPSWVAETRFVGDTDEVIESTIIYGAESFRSYKVAPDLSSYTKAELVSSIAGPQGTAAYDEVVYDPIAQSRLSAETATQRFKNYGNSLSGDTVCPACGDESWDEYSDGDEWRGYCGCGYDFDAGSALPNPLLTFYEMEALKEQGKLTSDQKEYLEWRITSTLSDLDSSSHNKKYIQDELVAHGWTLDRWGNAEPPEESVATLVGNAESINSFSPARLIILGASIGVALGLYNTRGE